MRATMMPCCSALPQRRCISSFVARPATSQLRPVRHRSTSKAGSNVSRCFFDCLALMWSMSRMERWRALAYVRLPCLTNVIALKLQLFSAGHVYTKFLPRISLYPSLQSHTSDNLSCGPCTDTNVAPELRSVLLTPYPPGATCWHLG